MSASVADPQSHDEHLHVVEQPCFKTSVIDCEIALFARAAMRTLPTAIVVALAATPAAGSYLQRLPAQQAQPRGRTAAARATALRMAETAVVTDGTDSFYGSRTIFQMLHDHGDFSKITAFSSSVVDAKKMCISRNARYSGLIDILEFAEGGDPELSTTFGECSTWVAMNADEASVMAQAKAAAAAGVKRAFIHLPAAEASSLSADDFAAAFAGTSCKYTLMRTGTLGKVWDMATRRRRAQRPSQTACQVPMRI